MIRDLIIVGCGGFGREVADVVDAINRTEPAWNLLGFVDDAPSPSNMDRLEQRGSRHLGTIDDFPTTGATSYAVGVGSPEARRRLVASAEARGISPATLVHPTANIGASVGIGAGTIIAGHVDIGSNAMIGEHVHLDRSVQIGHDASIGDFVTIHPAAVVSGACRVGPGTELGTNCTLLPTIEIGTSCVVGAAACVVHDVASALTVKGVPAT